MAQLIVRNVEAHLVRKLKARAGAKGTSMEEEHRRILREALLGSQPRVSLNDYILAMPDAGKDEAFARPADPGRKVKW